MYGDDLYDVYARAPTPEMMTHLTIDDAYFEWYKEKTESPFCTPCPPFITRAFRIWKDADEIDWSNPKELRFKTTTKDRCIYLKKIKGRSILLLRQLDNFCCVCTAEQDAKNIYNLIGTKIQFQSEQDKGNILFEYLGLVKDYNGTNLVQTNKYIEMNCSNYIARFLKYHG